MAEGVKRIGFIATGNELLTGDILNTNGQSISRQLIEHAMLPGQQVTVGDNAAEIEAAIRYLRPNHSAIITIGGLGPTVDDLTRQGLAQALDLPLEYSPKAWDWIVEKILSLGYTSVPENNRQQAYFPKGATVLRNLQGTAAACHLHHQQHDFFMLPGPPNECLPLFQTHVLETLIKAGYASKLQRKSWLLLGASEGEMAAQLEPLLSAYAGVELGFRVSYPYLEVKLVSDHPQTLAELSKAFVAVFHAQLISEHHETASQQLKRYLLEHKIALKIEDHATHGALLQTLLNPQTYPWLLGNEADIHVSLTGLDHYWQKNQEHTDTITMRVTRKNTSETFVITVPLRDERTLPSAVERVAWRLLGRLRTEA